jgi:hypothetical protein
MPRAKNTKPTKKATAAKDDTAAKKTKAAKKKKKATAMSKFKRKNRKKDFLIANGAIMRELKSLNEKVYEKKMMIEKKTKTSLLTKCPVKIYKIRKSFHKNLCIENFTKNRHKISVVKHETRMMALMVIRRECLLRRIDTLLNLQQ